MPVRFDHSKKEIGETYVRLVAASRMHSSAADRLCGRGLPGWHRDPVQILSRYHRAAERRCGLGGEPLNVVMLVALREMSEHEQPCPGLGRHAAGLPGGQVAPLAGPGGLR